VISEQGKRIAAQLGNPVWGALDAIGRKKRNGLNQMEMRSTSPSEFHPAKLSRPATTVQSEVLWIKIFKEGLVAVTGRQLHLVGPEQSENGVVIGKTDGVFE
jgi:hypothetical protein